jgi:hypothetical protein
MNETQNGRCKFKINLPLINNDIYNNILTPKKKSNLLQNNKNYQLFGQTIKRQHPMINALNNIISELKDKQNNQNYKISQFDNNTIFSDDSSKATDTANFKCYDDVQNLTPRKRKLHNITDNNNSLQNDKMSYNIGKFLINLNCTFPQLIKIFSKNLYPINISAQQSEHILIKNNSKISEFLKNQFSKNTQIYDLLSYFYIYGNPKNILSICILFLKKCKLFKKLGINLKIKQLKIIAENLTKQLHNINAKQIINFLEIIQGPSIDHLFFKFLIICGIKDTRELIDHTCFSRKFIIHSIICYKHGITAEVNQEKFVQRERTHSTINGPKSLQELQLKFYLFKTQSLLNLNAVTMQLKLYNLNKERLKYLINQPNIVHLITSTQQRLMNLRMVLCNTKSSASIEILINTINTQSKIKFYKELIVCLQENNALNEIKDHFLVIRKNYRHISKLIENYKSDLEKLENIQNDLYPIAKDSMHKKLPHNNYNYECISCLIIQFIIRYLDPMIKLCETNNKKHLALLLAFYPFIINKFEDQIINTSSLKSIKLITPNIIDIMQHLQLLINKDYKHYIFHFYQAYNDIFYVICGHYNERHYQKLSKYIQENCLQIKLPIDFVRPKIHSELFTFEDLLDSKELFNFIITEFDCNYHQTITYILKKFTDSSDKLYDDNSLLYNFSILCRLILIENLNEDIIKESLNIKTLDELFINKIPSYILKKMRNLYYLECQNLVDILYENYRAFDTIELTIVLDDNYIDLTYQLNVLRNLIIIFQKKLLSTAYSTQFDCVKYSLSSCIIVFLSLCKEYNIEHNLHKLTLWSPMYHIDNIQLKKYGLYASKLQSLIPQIQRIRFKYFSQSGLSQSCHLNKIQQ